MSTREKRLAKVRQNPKAVRFSTLRAILIDLGFTARTGHGDHWVFGHPHLTYSITIDPGGQFVKRVYVKQALAAIDEVSD